MNESKHTSTMTSTDNESLDAIKQAMVFNGEPGKLQEYYDEWAKTYDDDVMSEAYCGPELITDLLANLSVLCDLQVDTKDPDLKILDAGCGTGLVGAILQQKGYRQIDGCDLSVVMVEEARKTGAYQALEGDIDLTRRNEVYADGQYDAVLCCGTFTGGHLPPEGLEELVRMARPQGLVLVSTRKSYYDTTDFEGVYTRLQQEGRVELLHRLMDAPYIAEEGAHYFAFKVC